MSATAILPYVGAFLGAIPAILIALTISWETALLVAGLYVLINQVEGNLITPKIQGTAVRVHPLLIFISVIGGTQIAGFLGAVLAVPTLAVVRVLTEFLWERLRVRHPHDTVLVALGGEDDGAEEWTEEDEALATTSTAGEDGSRVDIRTGYDTDITIDADRGTEITIDKDDGGEDAETPVRHQTRQSGLGDRKEIPVAAGYRAKPTVRRRAIRRTHARPRIASGSQAREPVRSHT
jgi:prepilin signal peptidase PulO-like enzyme (type II secretory pathway)